MNLIISERVLKWKNQKSNNLLISIETRKKELLKILIVMKYICIWRCQRQRVPKQQQQQYQKCQSIGYTFESHLIFFMEETRLRLNAELFGFLWNLSFYR